jgi:hypothetical protein
MIMPPLVIDVRIQEVDSRRHRVWIPLFLLWPFMLIVVGAALVVSLIVDFVLILSGARYHHFTLLLIGAGRVLAETRGTTAHIRAHDKTHVDVEVY